MFEHCHTPQETAHFLRHRYGLPVRLLAGRPSVTTGSVLGAIVMPPELGRKVLAVLDRTHPAPVIAEPGGRSWTFLVTPPFPATPVSIPTRRYLAEYEVTVVPGGHCVLLPESDTPHGWHWAGEPAPEALHMPLRSAVIDAVYTVTGNRVGAH
ncbi:hypothetical protein [Nocardia callitridis]|uniref:DNA primase/polymerase bifunctional N-terminal domain-containing protein n=1 Tax=Nocardia callitridis TaxID=648753 RepID=A0ABP9JY39_9NOCA